MKIAGITTGIGNVITDYAAKGIERILTYGQKSGLKSDIFQKGGRNWSNNFFNRTNKWWSIFSSTAIGGAVFAVGTNAIKDAVNCYYYTTQTLNNKRMPKEKRKFSAAMDLINGILNVSVGILLGFTLSMDWCVNGLFKLFFKRPFNKICERMKNKDIYKNVDKAEYKQIVEKLEKGCTKGLKAFLSLVACTIVAKRMITPFLSTPIAGWAKSKYMKDDKKPSTGDKIDISKNPNIPHMKGNGNIEKLYEQVMLGKFKTN